MSRLPTPEDRGWDEAQYNVRDMLSGYPLAQGPKFYYGEELDRYRRAYNARIEEIASLVRDLKKH